MVISNGYFKGPPSQQNYMLKINNRNIRTGYEICSKLTIKTPEPDFMPLGKYRLYINPLTTNVPLI